MTDVRRTIGYGLRRTCLVAVAALLGSSASSQNLGEDRAWQFKTDSRTATQANTLQLIQLKESGYFDLIGSGFGGGAAGGVGGGLLGASAAHTNNFFQFIDQSQTTNNCSSTGQVGAPITCGGHGGNRVGDTNQTSAGNTQNGPNITGNTVTSSGNTNTNNNTANNGNNNNNSTTNNGPAKNQ